MIYRGAGWMTLLTPLAMVLLLSWLLMDPSAKSSDLSLMQFLLAVGIGSAINVVLGFVLKMLVRGVPGKDIKFLLSGLKRKYCTGLEHL
uniref:Uncharacterized protein n=1 Tax=Pseudomonas graminis TaxID=158627 RepID=A0A7C1WPV7_9PSED